MILIPTQYTSPSCTNQCLIHPKKLISNPVKTDHCPFPLQHLDMSQKKGCDFDAHGILDGVSSGIKLTHC